MSARLKLLEAAYLREKSSALAELASAEALLENIGDDHEADYMELLISRVKKIVDHEHTMNALQMYFISPNTTQKKPAPPPTTAPATPAGTEPIGHEELMKRSKTYRDSVSEKPSKNSNSENFKKSLKDKFNEKK